VEKEQNFCKISIIDNGKGIPIEQQEKIFSPSFTTKSSGMGLGLAMVKNIVEITGGRISFESDVNVGTSFYIWLPVFRD
jgi:signal transduction histidine kinase